MPGEICSSRIKPGSRGCRARRQVHDEACPYQTSKTVSCERFVPCWEWRRVRTWGSFMGCSWLAKDELTTSHLVTDTKPTPAPFCSLVHAPAPHPHLGQFWPWAMHLCMMTKTTPAAWQTVWLQCPWRTSRRLKVRTRRHACVRFSGDERDCEMEIADTGSQQGADRLSPCLAVHGNGEVISAPEPSRLPSSFAAPQGRPHIVAASAVLGRPHMFAASAARSSEER